MKNTDEKNPNLVQTTLTKRHFSYYYAVKTSIQSQHTPGSSSTKPTKDNSSCQVGSEETSNILNFIILISRSNQDIQSLCMQSLSNDCAFLRTL